MSRVPTTISYRLRKFGCWLGILAFCVGLFLSSRELLKLEITFGLTAFLMVVLLGLVATLLSALRFRVLAMALDRDIPLASSLAVIVWGGLANILPLPGAFLVRVGYLAKLVGVKRSTFANFHGMAIWFFVAAMLSVVFYPSGPKEQLIFYSLWLVLFASGIAAAFMVFVAQMNWRQVCVLFFLQLLMTSLNILRLTFSASALGFDLEAFAAALFALSGVAASATGIFPSGIGIGEAFASGIAILLGFSASIGFTVAALNRFSGWVGLAVCLPFVMGKKPEDSLNGGGE